MQNSEPDALRLARDFAPQAEEILGVEGIADSLNQLSQDDAAFDEARSRAFDIGDIGSVARAIISLFKWIGQIRRGQYLRGASDREIIRDLCIRILDSDALSQEAKERLIKQALDRFPVANE